MGNYYDSNVYVNTTTVYNNGQGVNVIPTYAGKTDPGLRPIRLKIPTFEGLGIDLSQWTQRDTGTAQSPNLQPQWCKIVTPESKHNFNNTPFSLLGVLINASTTGAQIGMGFTQPKIMVGANTKTNYFSSDSDIVGGDSTLEASSTAFGSVKVSRGSTPYRRIIPTGYQFKVVTDGSIGLLRPDSIGFFTDELFEGYYPVFLSSWEPNSDDPSEGYNYLNFFRDNTTTSVDMGTTWGNNKFLITNTNNPSTSNLRMLCIANGNYNGSMNNGYMDTAFGAGISGETTRMFAAGINLSSSNTTRYNPVRVPTQNPDTLALGSHYAGLWFAQPNTTTLDGSINFVNGADTQNYYCASPYTLVWDETNDHWYILSFNYFMDSSKNKACYLELQQLDASIQTGNEQYLTKLFDLQPPEPGPEPPEPGDDPYQEIEQSEEGGGEGTLDWTSDDVEDDSGDIYTPFVADDASTGTTPLYNVYHMGINPSLSLAQLHTYMWTDSDFLDAITKSNADIRQSIISLHALPYVCTFDSSSSPEIILCGHGCGVHALGGVPQKEDFDLGSVQLDEFYGSYLDYSPFTSVSIYLPFIGHRDLPVDQVMGKTINVKYTFDNYTGNCVARVLADGNLIDCYNGQCSLTYPITGADYSQKLMGTIMTVGGIAAVAGGLLSMGGSLAAGAAIGKVATAGALSGGAKMLAGGAASAMLGASNADKANVYHNSNLGGSTSWYAHRTPYLIITSPRLAHPTDKLVLAGGRTVRTETIGDLSGYTQFDIVHIDQVTCSDEERELIEEIMTSGVIL